MKCEHDWDIGSAIYIDNTIKIQAECILCNETIIVDFKDEYSNEREKVENDRSLVRPKSFS